MTVVVIVESAAVVVGVGAAEATAAKTAKITARVDFILKIVFGED